MATTVKKPTRSVKADAEFLERADAEQWDVTAATSLHRSNLLQLQTNQLLDEVCGSTEESTWYKIAQEYIQFLEANILSKIPAVTLETSKNSKIDCPFPLNLADRAVRVSMDNQEGLKLLRLPHNHEHDFTTKLSGNAQVLPTLERTVLLPELLFHRPDSESHSKDYLRNRYFDKRNLIVWHVAQFLSSKLLSLGAGRVYWRFWHGDTRKPVLLIVPPTKKDTPLADTPKKKKSRKSKTKDYNTSIPMTKKLKFRILLHFEMESIDWIPPLRLIPNRCNLQNANKTSYHYNHALLEDAQHLFWKCALTGKSPRSSIDDDDDNATQYQNQMEEDFSSSRSSNSNLHKATALIQIWCLQRGLLRAHDGLTMTVIQTQLLYLVRTKQIASTVRLTPLQIFTVWCKFAANTNWLGGGIHTSKDTFKNQKDAKKSKDAASKKHRDILVLPLPGGYKNERQTIAASSLARLYADQTKLSPLAPDDPLTLIELYRTKVNDCPVLLDPSMTYNFMGRLSASFTFHWSREAAKSLNCLQSQQAAITSGTNSLQQNAVVPRPFAGLFMTEARFWKSHDLYVRFDLRHLESLSTTHYQKIFPGSEAPTKDDVGSFDSLVRGMIHVLQVALGDRIHSIRTLSTGNGAVKEYTQQRKSSSSNGAIQDSDEIPTNPVVPLKQAQGDFKQPSRKNILFQSPLGCNHLVLGITVNPDTCFRVVDRGPPADFVEEVQSFVELWGRQKAELRRFKDGAIVHAVVWDSVPSDNGVEGDYVQFQNDDKWQGGIVERIIRHLVKLHFVKSDTKNQKLKMEKDAKNDEQLAQVEPEFCLRNMNSIIDGVASKPATDKPDVAKKMLLSNPLAAHRIAMKAFDQLTSFLRKQSAQTIPVPGSSTVMKSPLGLPLAIDAVEALSPTLRYAELFPPIPHPMLGGSAIPGRKKVSCAVLSDPIEIQIRFGNSSKWPNDLKAIGAAKTAMLIALVNGIEFLKQQRKGDADEFDGPTVVTPSYADVGFMGFVFRIFVRADPEIRLLRSLVKPSPEAVLLLNAITHKTIIAATHHNLVHAVYTKHPSSSAVTRMVRRWIASHLLSDHIPFEAMELLVAHVYTDRSSPLDPPGTVTTGFSRVLQLLAFHDWEREPLIVDPQGHLSDGDYTAITAEFEHIRGGSQDRGPPMYIVSPCNRSGTDSDVTFGEEIGVDTKSWLPTFTLKHPEQVVLNRTVTLAERTQLFLGKCQTDFNSDSWISIFQESPTAFDSYSALLRVDSAFLFDACSSSTSVIYDVSKTMSQQVETPYTTSMICRIEGPKELRLKLYRNLMGKEANSNILLEWRPVNSMMHTLRAKLGSLALFFYNDLCPDVIAVVWRKPLFQSRAFSAMNSEYVQPITVDDWKNDTLVTLNIGDILRETVQYTSDIVVDLKIFDNGPEVKSTSCKKRHLSEIMASDGSGEGSESSQDAQSDSD